MTLQIKILMDDHCLIILDNGSMCKCIKWHIHSHNTAALAATIEVDSISRDKPSNWSGKSYGSSVLLITSFLSTGLESFKVDLHKVVPIWWLLNKPLVSPWTYKHFETFLQMKSFEGIHFDYVTVKMSKFPLSKFLPYAVLHYIL